MKDFETISGLSAPNSLKGCLIALGAFLAILAFPTSHSLGVEGHRLIALSVACLILWVTEALPISVTAIIAIAGQAFIGVTTLRQASVNFISPVFFFVLAIFLFAACIRHVKLDHRFAHWLLERSGTNTKNVVFAFMFGTAAISSIMSDVPACAIWMTLALGVLRKEGLTPGESNLGKALMLGITIAALIGGVATPAGSSINIMGLVMLSDLGGGTVPFLKWMAIGVPMVLILIPISWKVLIWFYPPEIEKLSKPVVFSDGPRKGFSSAEVKVVMILGVVLVLWILSNWFPQKLDVTMVALMGSILFFLPGIRIMSWNDASRAISWDILLMIGGVTSIGLAIRDTGLATWVVTALFEGVGDVNTLWLILGVSAFTVLIHLVVPIGPIVNAVMIPPIVALAIAIDQPPMLIALPVIFTASCAFLIPLDAVALITYSKGYYKMFDMFWPGAIISTVWVVVLTGLILLLVPWLGLIP
ncbi:DASS family sodium-coupled anion symporter [Opitutaceae bacterium]|nr:DASS family sodium-coupled anion symporter [Opitutaceae bacterium]